MLLYHSYFLKFIRLLRVKGTKIYHKKVKNLTYLKNQKLMLLHNKMFNLHSGLKMSLFRSIFKENIEFGMHFKSLAL